MSRDEHKLSNDAPAELVGSAHTSNVSQTNGSSHPMVTHICSAHWTDEYEVEDCFEPEAGADLACALPPVAPSEDLRLRLMSVVAHTPQDECLHPGNNGMDLADEEVEEASVDPAVIPFPLWRRLGNTAVRVAAAVALVAVGTGIGRWSAMDDMSDEMHYAHLNAATDVYRMDSMMDDGNMATLTWSLQMEMTAVTIPNEMQAPRGRVLQVWKRVDGEVSSVGFYTPHNGALFSFIDAMPMPGLEILITLEPAGGSPQPTTEPLLVFTVGMTDQGVEATRNGDASTDLPSSEPEVARL